MYLSLSKIILLLIFILIIPLKNTFSEECDELTKARMIKAGISDEIIKNQCDGKSKVVEESKPEVEVDSNNLHTKYLRFYLGSAQGTFNFSSNDALDGDFDHDLSGVAFGASYIKIDDGFEKAFTSTSTLAASGYSANQQEELIYITEEDYPDFAEFMADMSTKSYVGGEVRSQIGHSDQPVSNAIIVFSQAGQENVSVETRSFL